MFGRRIAGETEEEEEDADAEDMPAIVGGEAKRLLICYNPISGDKGGVVQGASVAASNGGAFQRSEARVSLWECSREIGCVPKRMNG